MVCWGPETGHGRSETDDFVNNLTHCIKSKSVRSGRLMLKLTGAIIGVTKNWVRAPTVIIKGRKVINSVRGNELICGIES